MSHAGQGNQAADADPQAGGQEAAATFGDVPYVWVTTNPFAYLATLNQDLLHGLAYGQKWG